MILFRKVDEPLPAGWEPGAHWFVEYYPDDPLSPYPEGIAFVCAFPRFAIIDYTFVVDHKRGNGIWHKIVEACRERWPGIRMGRA
jgi:hypothetical protein